MRKTQFRKSFPYSQLLHKNDNDAADYEDDVDEERKIEK